MLIKVDTSKLPIKEFVKVHIMEIENGAFFTPRQSHRRPLWMYYPTDRFPFYTFEVEEPVFPVKLDGDISILAEGVRIDNNQKVVGDLIRRPMLTFAYEVHNARYYYCPLYYWCCEIFNQQGKFTIHRDNFNIIKVVDYLGRSIRNYNLPSFQF